MIFTGRTEDMSTDTAFDDEFGQTLYTAALADYFYICEQMKVGDERETIASKPVAEAFQQLFDMLGITCEGFIDNNNPVFVHLVFASAAEKERVDAYFSNFNLGLRSQYAIPMPDIYEGHSVPVEKVYQQYQTTIHHFFTPNSGRPLRIPIGKDSTRIAAMAKTIVGQFHGVDEGERAGRTIHAEYTTEGLIGFTFFNNW